MEAEAKQQPEAQSSPPTKTVALSRAERTSVQAWQALDWTQERIDLARKQVAPPTATEAEFKFFLEWCQQTGLNPFVKQAYLIERYDSQSNTKKHEPMAAEAGFAARADALPDFRGMKSGVVFVGDQFGIDEETQTVVHQWDIATRIKNGNKVLGAWAHATREGRLVEISWVTVESRIQKKRDGTPNVFWLRDPAGQIRKCARADQYRRAYPNIFAGWYDPAESIDEEREVNAPPPAPTKPTGKSDALRERLKKQAQTVDAAKASPPQGTKAGPPPVDCVRFGPFKGTLIADVATADLEAANVTANQQLVAASGKEAWVPSVREGIAAIAAELERRGLAAPADDTQHDEPTFA